MWRMNLNQTSLKTIAVDKKENYFNLAVKYHL